MVDPDDPDEQRMRQASKGVGSSGCVVAIMPMPAITCSPGGLQLGGLRLGRLPPLGRARPARWLLEDGARRWRYEALDYAARRAHP